MADISEIKEKSWNLGKQRIDVIRSLAEKSLCCKNSVEEAARKLHLSKRHIYNLIKKFRESWKTLTSLIPLKPKGGKGKVRK